MKRQIIYRNLLKYFCCKRFYCNSLCCFYNLITCNHLYIVITSIVLPTYLGRNRIHNIHFFAHMMFFQIFTLTPTFAWYLLDTHTCLIYVSLINYILLKALRFKSSVLFGTHALLEKSLITTSDISKLTGNW